MTDDREWRRNERKVEIESGWTVRIERKEKGKN